MSSSNPHGGNAQHEYELRKIDDAKRELLHKQQEQELENQKQQLELETKKKRLELEEKHLAIRKDQLDAREERLKANEQDNEQKQNSNNKLLSHHNALFSLIPTGTDCGLNGEEDPNNNLNSSLGETALEGGNNNCNVFNTDEAKMLDYLTQTQVEYNAYTLGVIESALGKIKREKKALGKEMALFEEYKSSLQSELAERMLLLLPDHHHKNELIKLQSEIKKLKKQLRKSNDRADFIWVQLLSLIFDTNRRTYRDSSMNYQRCSHSVRIENLNKNIALESSSQSLVKSLWEDGGGGLGAFGGSNTFTNTSSGGNMGFSSVPPKRQPFLAALLTSDWANGNIPHNLEAESVQIFISSPSIINGAWIQIHGPGSVFQSDMTISLESLVPYKQSHVSASFSSFGSFGGATSSTSWEPGLKLKWVIPPRDSDIGSKSGHFSDSDDNSEGSDDGN